MQDGKVLTAHDEMSKRQKYILRQLRRPVGATSLEYIEEVIIDVEKAREIAQLAIKNGLSHITLDAEDLALILLSLGIGVNKRSAADLYLLEDYPITEQYIKDEINTVVHWYKDDLDEIYDVVMQTLNMKEAQSKEIMSLGI